MTDDQNWLACSDAKQFRPSLYTSLELIYSFRPMHFMQYIGAAPDVEYKGRAPGRQGGRGVRHEIYDSAIDSVDNVWRSCICVRLKLNQYRPWFVPS